MTLSRTYLPLRLISLIVLASVANAEEKKSLEQSTIEVLRRGFRTHQIAHHGVFPTNWTEIGEYIDLNSLNERLVLGGLEPVQRLYGFVKKPVRVPGDNTETVLLVRTIPLKERHEVGRPLLVNVSTNVEHRWVAEDAVQEIFRQAGVPLPEADEKEAQKAMQALDEASAERDAIRQAREEEGRRILQEEAEQPPIVQQPSLPPTGRRTQNPETSSQRVPPVPLVPKTSPTNIFFRWIGIGFAGLLGVGLVIVLLRGSGKR